MSANGEGTAPASVNDLTRLLEAWGTGDQDALQRLIPFVYKKLHRRAHHSMAAEQSGQTLQATTLVHKVYLRLVGVKNVKDGKTAPISMILCAHLMWRFLVDFVRSRNNQKRGGHFPHIELEESATVSAAVGSELLAGDEVELASVDARKSTVVELRFFGGLTVEETAGALGASVETVMRDWKLAKAWFLRELSPEAAS